VIYPRSDIEPGGYARETFVPRPELTVGRRQSRREQMDVDIANPSSRQVMSLYQMQDFFRIGYMH